MQEEDARLFAGHVRVDGNDVDAGVSQCLEHVLQLGFEHGEIAVDDGLGIGTRKRRPGVHAQGVSDGHPMLFRRAAPGRLVHAIVDLALLAEEGIEFRCIDGALGRIDVHGGHLAFLLQRREYLAHRRGQLRFVTDAADVHEHHFRRVPEEVIVERGHLEAVVKRHAHRPVHLVLGEHHVAHHHRVRALAAERRPGGETERRRQLDARCRRADVVARVGNLEGAFLLVHLPLEPGQLLDVRGVQRGQHDGNRDHALLLWALSRRRLTSSHWTFWKNASTYFAAAAP